MISILFVFRASTVCLRSDSESYDEEIVKLCETEPPVEKEEWTPSFNVSEVLLWFTTTASEICAQLAVAPCWKAVDKTACKLEYRRKSTIALYSDKQWLKGIFLLKNNNKVSGYWWVGTVNNVNIGLEKEICFCAKSWNEPQSMSELTLATNDSTFIFLFICFGGFLTVNLKATGARPNLFPFPDCDCNCFNVMFENIS